jgi:crotonobetainyl-CoA:carnitine CoA-transferase CaiB-like acyl-CoA transferase
MPETPAGWRSTGTSLAAVFAALGIMAAIRRQQIEPGAQYVSVSLWGSALWWNWRDLNTYAGLGHAWPDYGDLGSRYAMYPTSDERVLILCPGEQKFWERFCDLLGLPSALRARGDWSTSRMDFGRGPAYADEREIIAQHTRSRTLDEWLPLLAEAGIPFAPVLTWVEAVAGDHAASNAVMRPVPVGDTTTELAAVPVSVGPGPPAPVVIPLPPAPPLGADTASFLDELGLGHLADQLAGTEGHES